MTQYDIPGVQPPTPPAPRPVQVTALWVLMSGCAVLLTVALLADLVNVARSASSLPNGSRSDLATAAIYGISTALDILLMAALVLMVVLSIKPKPWVRPAAFAVLGMTFWESFSSVGFFGSAVVSENITWLNGAETISYLGVACLSVPAIVVLAAPTATAWYAGTSTTP